ncbi:MAG: hypothetical protein ACC646_07370 [Paracoccaceae bacterium]
MLLSACAGSNLGDSLGRLNPLNLFSAQNRAEAGPATLAPRHGYVQVSDSRPLIGQISGLWDEDTVSGIILRASAVAPRLGYYSADLVPVASSVAGELVFEFRVRPPLSATRVGAVRQRTLSVATTISHARLAGVHTIRVLAAQNSKTVRP